MADSIADARFWLGFMLAGCAFAVVAGLVWAADVFRQMNEQNKGDD